MNNLDFIQRIKKEDKMTVLEGVIQVYNIQEKLLLIIAEESAKANERLYNMERALESIELMIRQRK